MIYGLTILFVKIASQLPLIIISTMILLLALKNTHRWLEGPHWLELRRRQLPRGGIIGCIRWWYLSNKTVGPIIPFDPKWSRRPNSEPTSSSRKAGFGEDWMNIQAMVLHWGLMISMVWWGYNGIYHHQIESNQHRPWESSRNIVFQPSTWQRLCWLAGW